MLACGWFFFLAGQLPDLTSAQFLGKRPAAAPRRGLFSFCRYLLLLRGKPIQALCSASPIYHRHFLSETHLRPFDCGFSRVHMASAHCLSSHYGLPTRPSGQGGLPRNGSSLSLLRQGSFSHHWNQTVRRASCRRIFASENGSGRKQVEVWRPRCGCRSDFLSSLELMQRIDVYSF